MTTTIEYKLELKKKNKLLHDFWRMMRDLVLHYRFLLLVIQNWAVRTLNEGIRSKSRFVEFTSHFPSGADH